MITPPYSRIRRYGRMWHGPCRVNRDHPLGSQCVLFFTPSQYGFVDLARNAPATLTSGCVRSSNVNGASMDVSGSGNAQFPAVADYNVANLTILWAGIPTNFTVYRTMLSKTIASGGDNPYDSYLTQSTGTINFSRGDGVNYRVFVSSGAASAGVYTTVGISAAGTNNTLPLMVLNNVAQTVTDAGGASSGNPTTNTQPPSISRRNDGATQMVGQVNFCVLLRQALSIQDMILALADPYAMLEPIATSVYVGATSPPPPPPSVGAPYYRNLIGRLSGEGASV